MFVQKVPHIKDQFLTQERASMELESGQIAVGWYTNEQDSQSVVHSHPYYELVLPLVGSNVRYSVDGNIYDINLGEMIIFPARCYHAGMFNITDKISERLIAQINAELWQEALLASGLELVGMVIFAVWLVPVRGYRAVCFCEPTTWVVCFVFILLAVWRCRGDLRDAEKN